MTTPAADYDAAVTALRSQKLPAYVEYTVNANASGIAGYHGVPERVVVDVVHKKVISTTSRDGDEYGDSPVLKHLFDPSCFTATTERMMNWNGRAVVAIGVHGKGNSCDDLSLHTVFVDPSTNALLGADGSETDEGMTVDFSVQYGTFQGYVMPTVLSAHAHGHGWLFWARERAQVRYSDYSFTNVRRQSE